MGFKISVLRSCQIFAEFIEKKLLCVKVNNVPNPNYGMLSFDHMGWAMLMVWQIFTHDMWVSV